MTGLIIMLGVSWIVIIGLGVLVCRMRRNETRLIKEQNQDAEIASNQVTGMLIEKRALIEYIHNLPSKFWPKRKVS